MRNAPKTSNDHLKNLWRRYVIFINRRTRSEKNDRNKNQIWKDRFFTEIIKFAVPAGTLSLIASVIIECSHTNYQTAIIDLVAFVSILIVLLHKRIPIRCKKFFGVTVMILFSVLKIITLHSLMFGTIFLLLLSVFLTLLFDKKIAYLSVFVNTLICITFNIALAKGFKMHKLDLLNYDIPDRWMLYTFNFVFCNLVMVAIILYIINGFEKTIQKSDYLYLKLRLEVEEKIAKENLLQESLTHYKSLFFFNPLPMLIYDPVTLRLLHVNKTAIKYYGYTRKEFFKMKVTQLVQCADDAFRNKIRRDYVHQKDIHYHKNGKRMLVDINASNIRLNGSWVRLAIIRDITAETEYIAAIEKTNENMREIAYLQSHVIRSPLSRILGITSLLRSESIDATELDQFLNYLTHSAEELDTVIANIVKYTEEEMKEYPIQRR